MTLSALDLFTIGVGPSFSHTVGPMRAASRFVRQLEALGLGPSVARLRCDLYGSLAATGKGHGTGGAVILGFLGEEPESVDVDVSPARLAEIRLAKRLRTVWGAEIEFDEKIDLDFKRLKPLPLHPNGMHLMAVDSAGNVISEEVVYSLGGGFIATEAEMKKNTPAQVAVKHPFTNAASLMRECESTGLSVCQLVLENEAAFRSEHETRARLDAIWVAMQSCVKRGCQQQGTLPGGLQVKRRAKSIHDNLCNSPEAALKDPLTILDWVNLYALAVNEENAAGGGWSPRRPMVPQASFPQFCTTPIRFRHSPYPDGVHRFLLTAAAIGMHYKLIPPWLVVRMNSQFSCANAGLLRMAEMDGFGPFRQNEISKVQGKTGRYSRMHNVTPPRYTGPMNGPPVNYRDSYDRAGRLIS